MTIFLFTSACALAGYALGAWLAYRYLEKRRERNHRQRMDSMTADSRKALHDWMNS